NYTTVALLCIKQRQSAAKTIFKGQQTLTSNISPGRDFTDELRDFPAHSGLPIHVTQGWLMVHFCFDA
ncbi:MAG: hypothetical protein LPD71_02385, partial [Shewanella sp.]|nr:hypothetical protein [Shewanella sp.]